MKPSCSLRGVMITRPAIARVASTTGTPACTARMPASKSLRVRAAAKAYKHQTGGAVDACRIHQHAIGAAIGVAISTRGRSCSRSRQTVSPWYADGSQRDRNHLRIRIHIAQKAQLATRKGLHAKAFPFVAPGHSGSRCSTPSARPSPGRRTDARRMASSRLRSASVPTAVGGRIAPVTTTGLSDFTVRWRK